MKCSQCRSLLGMYLDGELSTEQSGDVESHLERCDECRSEMTQWRRLDGHLRRLQVPDDLPQRIEERCGGESRVLTEERHAGWRRWALFAAVAASIALVVVLSSLRRGQGPVPIASEPGPIASEPGPIAGEPDPIAGEPDPPPVTLVGTLVRATGDVELRLSDQEDWRAVAASDPTPLPQGTQVRTKDKVLCEVETADRGAVRMDSQAEVVFHRRDQVEVVRGTVWCQASETASIEIQGPGLARPGSLETGTSDAGPPAPSPGSLWMMKCPSNSQLQLSVDGQVTAVASMSGAAADWDLGDFSCSVGPGETVTVGADHKIRRSNVIADEAKIWQLPLLAIEGRHKRELSDVLQPLLAPIGRTKARHLPAERIRALGPTGALPLLAYVVGEDSLQHPRERRSAMQIAAETADASAAPMLRTLAKDQDNYIAARARSALERLGIE